MTTATRQLTHEHRAQQLLIRKATQTQVAKVWPALDPNDLDASFQRFAGSVSLLVEKNRQTSAGLTASYLRTYRDMSGIPGSARIIVPKLDPEQFTTSLRTTSVVAVKRSMIDGKPIDQAMQDALTQASGAMARQVMNGGRETMAATLKGDSAARGYHRILGGGGCEFCQMLATRDNYSADTADFEAHDHCGCTGEPNYEPSAGGVLVPRISLKATQERLEAAAAVRELQPEPQYVEKIATALRADSSDATEQALRAALADPATKPLSRVNIAEALRVVEAERNVARATEAAKVAERAARAAVPDGSVAAKVDFPQDTLDALVPKGGWTTATRDKTVSALKETPEGRQLLKTMDSFQSGGSTAIPRLRSDIEKYLTGDASDMPQGRKDAIETFLSAVGRSDAGDRALFRGMSIPGDIEEVAARYRAGDDLDLSLASFSSDKKLAQDFTLKGAGQKVRGAKRTPVLVEWVGSGKRALPIEKLSKSRVFANEKEWVGAGRYQIEGVKRTKRNGVETVVLTIRQKGVW